jgi:hypothetical protein
MAKHVTMATEVWEPGPSERPATPSQAPVGAHLVGSAPLSSPEEVFRRTAAALGDRLRRLPDGVREPW